MPLGAVTVGDMGREICPLSKHWSAPLPSQDPQWPKVHSWPGQAWLSLDSPLYCSPLGKKLRVALNVNRGTVGSNNKLVINNLLNPQVDTKASNWKIDRNCLNRASCLAA